MHTSVYYRPLNLDSTWSIEFNEFLSKARDKYETQLQSIEDTIGAEEDGYTEILNDFFLTQLTTTAQNRDQPEVQLYMYVGTFEVNVLAHVALRISSPGFFRI